MIKIKTSKGTWRVNGIYFISSDATYKIIKQAIEEDKLTQEHLQEVTGHKYPITIDRVTKTITFESF